MNIVHYLRQLFPLNCGITDGMGIDCEDLRKPGGVYRAAWVFNLSDLLTPIDVTLASYVTNLNFTTYQSLYLFESAKFSHEATWQQQNGDGGNISYLQTVILRLANNNPTADRVIEDASVAELGVILKTNAGEFLILGAENGLSSGPASTGGTGRQSTDSTFTQLNLVGTERYLPKRLLIGGTATTTQAYLDAATA
jgi:hypothetical protein